MKSQTIVPAGTTYSNPLNRKPGGGDDGKKGPPISSKKPFDINDFDLTGEPQELSGVSNLSPDFASEDLSQTKSDPSQLQFDTLVSIDDGSREANAASEDSELEPKPAPLSTTTTPGPAQPTVKLSDDPAVAALEQAQLNCIQGVAFYAQLLGILDKALADNPQLPRNSFDGLKHMFSGAKTECATRAVELTKDATQLRNDRVAQAQALAAKAQSIETPIAPAAPTFSATPKTPISDVKVDQLMEEVVRLPEHEQRDQIIEGLQAALKEEGTVTDADLTNALHDIQWDLDHPDMKGVDPELVGHYRQLNKEAEETELDEPISNPDQQKPSTSQSLHNFFAEMDALGIKNASGKLQRTNASRPAAEKPAAKTESADDQALADLLKELEDAAEGPPPYANQSEQPIQGKPSPDLKMLKNEMLEEHRRECANEMARYNLDVMSKLNHAIQQAEKLTQKEEQQLKKIRGPEKSRKQLIASHAIKVIEELRQEESKVLKDASDELKKLRSNIVMTDAPDITRQKEMIKHEAQRNQSCQLIDSMNLMINNLKS